MSVSPLHHLTRTRIATGAADSPEGNALRDGYIVERSHDWPPGGGQPSHPLLLTC
jgi:hypothetical protein